MKNKQILEHLNNSINDAPINILDNIKNIAIIKMTEHDEVTSQDIDINGLKDNKTNNKATIFNYRSLVSLASFAAVFLFVFIGIWQFRIPDSQIYLDVNPSIQITTNRRDKVIDLKAINRDSIKIVEDIEYKNKDLAYITDEVITKLASEYLTNTSSDIDHNKDVMLISVYNKDSNKSDNQAEEIDQLVRNKLESYNSDSVILTQTIGKSNTVEQYANEYSISVGKMTFIRNLIILDPDFKTEDLVNLSLYELLELSANTGIDIDSIIDNKGDKDIQIETNTQATSNVETEESGEGLTNEPSEPTETKKPEPSPTKKDDLDNKDKGSSSKPKTPISMTKAQEIALAKTNGGKVIKSEYDDDDYKYEFEIINGNFEYEVEVDAFTGKIIYLERDEIDDDDDDDNYSSSTSTLKNIIHETKAQEIALARTNGGKVMDTEYDDDDHKYEIEIINGNYEYEVEVDAFTGEITDFDKDEIDDDD